MVIFAGFAFFEVFRVFLFYCPIGQSHFHHLWPQILCRVRLSTNIKIANVFTSTNFRHSWAYFWPSGAHKNSEGDLSRAHRQRKVFLSFFSTCFDIWNRNLVHTFGRWYDTSSLSCTAIWSLWPTIQPKIGQIRFSTHGFSIYMNPPHLALTLKKWVYWLLLQLGNFWPWWP